MEMHHVEELAAGDFDSRIRVPGGWIYQRRDEHSSTFVPEPPNIEQITGAAIATIAAVTVTVLRIVLSDAPPDHERTNEDQRNIEQIEKAITMAEAIASVGRGNLG
jgi:hypothetical protein